jgi:dipeptidyl aminopeptidase/acylaminoacyl peptidase
MDHLLQNEKIEEKFGKWVSPITPLMNARSDKSSRNTDILVKEGSVYWTEPRPLEKGRTALMRSDAQGKVEEIVSSDFDIRTKVHEYGGVPFTLHENSLYFIHNKDQRLYVQCQNETPRPITEGKIRYANLQGCTHGLIAIAEEHLDSQVNNFLVLLDSKTGKQTVWDSGHDFYASPILSPDEKKLAWLTWDHPNMPWDGTELWMADVVEGKLENKRCVAGGVAESIFQPQWSPLGTLFFVSDRTGWWNIYRLNGEMADNVCPMKAEFGVPQWRFGMSTWGFTGPGEQIICIYQQNGFGKLGWLNPESQALKPISLPFTDYSQINVGEGFAVMLMGSPTSPRRLMKLDLQTFEFIPLDTITSLEVDSEYFSIPKNIEFPTFAGKTAFGYYYAPMNKLYEGLKKERPPLLVFSHGGPTGCADPSFNLRVQYWTSRGFAVLDVNYGGSIGFGRAYRERLKGQWGIVDVKDCEMGALYLVECGLVNPSKLFIRGSSAGGYTTLASLAFTSTFSGGASYYGIGDLMAMAKDTHKFEARYLDGLVGSLPAAEKLYYDRSPLFHVEKFSCPVIFFQGEEDKIVPKNQAEMMYRALKEKGIKTKLVIYETEEHGFRQAAHIEDSMRQELEFYLSILSKDTMDRTG